MRQNAWRKIISALLAAMLAMAVAGCGALSEEDAREIQAESPKFVLGKSTGQALAPSYKADSIFSLNCVRDDSFNPFKAESTWNKMVGMLAYETLVTMDRNFEAQPNLITSWATNDGITWVFYVDTERSFHSGGHMTSADAVYSLQQAMYSSTRYSRRFANVASIYGQGEDTFTVVLTQPNFRFYQLLNIPCIESGSGGGDMPSGTGPYKFNRRGTQLLLDENHPNAGSMPLERVVLKEYIAADDILQAFEDSLIDLVVNDPSAAASLGYSSANITRYVDTTNLHYVGFNLNSSLFSQVTFRSMMTYAIDRDSIVYSAMGGAAVASVLPIHPNSSLYPQQIAETSSFNMDAFEQALSLTGAADVDYDGIVEFGNTKRTIDFIVCSDSGTKVAAARMIANQLQNAGLQVNLRELSYNSFLEELDDGDFDMYYAEVKICNDWDLTYLLSADAELNYGGVRDSTLEGYIRTFLGSEPDQLTASTEQMCQYLLQSAPIAVVCFERTEALYHRGVLSGLEPTQDSVFYNMQNWTVDLT